MTPKSGLTREARLAAALRENLKRRKAQARARAQMPDAVTGTGTGMGTGADVRAGEAGDHAGGPPEPRPKAAPKRR